VAWSADGSGEFEHGKEGRPEDAEAMAVP
jgi:hypothetical protein